MVNIKDMRPKEDIQLVLLCIVCRSGNQGLYKGHLSTAQTSCPLMNCLVLVQQRLSIAIMIGNASSICGTLGVLEEIFWVEQIKISFFLQASSYFSSIPRRQVWHVAMQIALLLALVVLMSFGCLAETSCPSEEDELLPCRCSARGDEIQLWWVKKKKIRFVN